MRKLRESLSWYILLGLTQTDVPQRVFPFSQRITAKKNWSNSRREEVCHLWKSYMKILLATPLYPPEIGGPATYTIELTERLHREHEITIVAYASTSVHVEGARLVTVSKKRPLPVRILKYTWVMWRESRGKDIIYAQNAVAAGFPSVIVGLLRRIPVIIKFVGDEPWEKATQQKLTTKQLEEFLANPDPVSLYIRFIRLIQTWTLLRAQIVTTPSQYLRDAIVRAYHIAPEHALVNYNATETADKLPFEGTVQKHQIVTTARLVEWKGIDGIIRAVALLTPRFPDIRLLVAGDGPDEEKLKKLTQELAVEKHVEFLGRVSRAETWHIRKTSEVYVLNSHYEGLPHTVLTSFSAGIPTIATDIPGTNEAVIHESTGLLVPVANDEALAEAIARLLGDEKLRASLVTGGERIIKEKFSWDAHLALLKKIFEQLTAKK